MFHGILVALVRLVTFVTADAGIPVGAVFPLLDQARHINMTLETFPGFLGEPRICRRGR